MAYLLCIARLPKRKAGYTIYVDITYSVIYIKYYDYHIHFTFIYKHYSYSCCYWICLCYASSRTYSTRTLQTNAGYYAREERGFEATQQEKKEAFSEKAKERKEEFGELSAERQAQLKEKMEVRKEEIKEKRDERKAVLQARHQERIANLAANVSNRMEAAIARIRQIIERFQSRVHTLSERGVDVTNAQRALDESSAHLDKASLLIAGIDILIADVIASESPREAWGIAKAQYTEIKEQIKAAHVSLREALSLLKEAVANTQRNVRSTVSEGNTEEVEDESQNDEPEV